MRSYKIERNTHILFTIIIILAFLVRQETVGVYLLLAYSVFSVYSAIGVYRRTVNPEEEERIYKEKQARKSSKETELHRA